MSKPIFRTLTATILEDGNLSDAVQIHQDHVVGIIMPATWDTADLTLQGSADGVNFFDVYDAGGSEVTLKADTAIWITLGFGEIAGYQAIKLRSGTSSAPVDQTGDRAITVVVRPYC